MPVALTFRSATSDGGGADLQVSHIGRRIHGDFAMMATMATQGWEGWDQYAPFYDWENARTVARRDVAFWQRLASAQQGPVLELGCGTGRIALPVARAGATVIG